MKLQLFQLGFFFRPNFFNKLFANFLSRNTNIYVINVTEFRSLCGKAFESIFKKLISHCLPALHCGSFSHPMCHVAVSKIIGPGTFHSLHGPRVSKWDIAFDKYKYKITSSFFTTVKKVTGFF